MSLINLITTSDGSHSLVNTALNETYHSVHGAITESKHVYIHNGLDFWLEQNGDRELRILEIGFGTGLNVLLTLLHAQSLKNRIYYESWEAFPLEDSIVHQLNYGVRLGASDSVSKIYGAIWDSTVQLTPSFALKKIHGDVLTSPISGSFDLVYYDAFAPSKQPAMWTIDILKKITDAMAFGGILVTYCAKGQLKRDLRTLGLTFETLPGPPGKKEMVRTKIQ
ncbi:MAG TPA: tRNA (5-methylaminomethyl-2-thiouridine)(34)-methyltransferase MnmD [Cyclobacteriaceae bacterium]|nr:tRNA (5-methylaminomethyl-2-thiouridine)(34)-methyltransferase MnmD [Cyclobacteriaceae bacterium]